MKAKYVVFALAVLIMLTSGCINSNPYQLYFAGQTVNFRADLNEAAKINITNETVMQNMLVNDDVMRIRIAYIPNDKWNAYYVADAFELAYKLTLVNKYYRNMVIGVETIPVNSTDDLVLFAEEPVILMIAESSQTGITVKENLVIVEGKDMTEIGRKYTDLDLATDRLLLSFMKNS